MNDNFGRDDRHRRQRHSVEGRYPLEERGPDQEFETSGPYREPSDFRAPDGAQAYGGGGQRSGGRGSSYGARREPYEGSYAPSYSAEIADRRPASPPAARGGYAGRGPKGYRRTDERIREEVCERLSWHDEVDATDVAVRVHDGEVTLEGSVETRHMKRLAEHIVEDVVGVTEVHNTIRVTKPILTELKEKLTGESQEQHYANTGTRTPVTLGARNGAL